jgi:flagellin
MDAITDLSDFLDQSAMKPGERRVVNISLAYNWSGVTLTNVVTAVNSVSNLTGVRASLLNGNVNSGVVFTSMDYGQDAFASVKRLGGPSDPTADSWKTSRLSNNAPYFVPSPANFATMLGAGTLELASRDVGKDVQALINGNLAAGKGIQVSMNTPSLGMELTLDASFATDPTLTPTNFTIAGGGAIFQVGPEVNALQQVGIGIGSVAASKLGGALVNGTVQYLSSLQDGQGNSIRDCVARGNFDAAQVILSNAIDDVTLMRGRMGAFEKNVLETNQRSLQSQFENLSASESSIRDADFAVESSKLTRAQILSSAGTSVLGLANQQSQQVLQLLG